MSGMPSAPATFTNAPIMAKPSALMSMYWGPENVMVGLKVRRVLQTQI